MKILIFGTGSTGKRIYNEIKGRECTIVKRVDTFFKEKYLRTVA